MDGAVVKNARFYNCGTSWQSGDNQRGVIQIEFHKNVLVENVEIDGNGLYLMGMWLGRERGKVVGTIANTTVHDLKTTSSLGSGGAGFLAHNSDLTFMNCKAYNLNKGWDLGEADGKDVDINYRIINALSWNNVYGMNFNSASTIRYTGNVKFYVINSVVRDNANIGIYMYGGPYTAYIVHNTLDNNGTRSSSGDGYANLCLTPDDATHDTSHIEAFVYNNIFHRPAGAHNFLVKAIGSGYDSDFNLFSDWNAWVQRANEPFCLWSWYVGQSQVTFRYGSDGPGRGASGQWYIDEGEPSSGIGHYHCDSNSVGTGADDPALPPFANIAVGDYTLSGAYAGKDLSSMSWYIVEMGVDRAGVNRRSWDLGAYEFGESGTTPRKPTITTVIGR